MEPRNAEAGVELTVPPERLAATVLGALQVSGAAEFEVGFGYFEPIVCSYHDFQTLTGILSQFIPRHQDAIGLVGSTPHPAPQLM